MENKRAIIAVVLSFIVLVGWGYLSEYMGWTPKSVPATEQKTAASAPAPSVVTSAPEAVTPAPAFSPSTGHEVTVTPPLYKAVLHSGGGVLRQFMLSRYHMGIDRDAAPVNLIESSAIRVAPLGLLVNGQPSWNTGQWAFEGGDLNLADGQTGTLRFVGSVDGLRVVRELEFHADSYLVTEKLHLAPEGDAPRTARVGFTLGTTSLTPGESQYNLTRVAWFADGSFSEKSSTGDLEKGVLIDGSIDWAGVMSNYFLAAVAPKDTRAVLKGKLEGGVYRVAVERPDQMVNPGNSDVIVCNYWFGPKERDLLNAAPNNLGKAIDLGWFGFIARPLVTLLDFFYKYVGNYGTAIILLTILIKLVFWPLSHKSYKSMEQMKKLQPMLAKVREKHADDREKMNEEMMRLYKTYKVNPAGGCLPMLVQIPVFFGLYQALLNAIELRHAPFIAHVPFTDIVWLADLSAKDPFYVTPLVMGATMFLQQKLTPPAGDPTQAKVMMFMPVVFTFLFLNFPSGLVVYWLCNNVLSIAQQWWILRKA